VNKILSKIIMNKKAMQEAKKRASSAQTFPHSMPAACTYNHLNTMIKPLNTSFFRDSIIKKIFLVEIITKNNFVHETFTNPAFKLYQVKSSDKNLSGLGWPYSNMRSFLRSVMVRPIIQNKNLNKTLSLEKGELFVFLIHAIGKNPTGHASAVIVHKNSKNEIEFFVLEPHGKIYDFHKKVAEKYFNIGPEKMYLPFDKIQGTNKLCIAHSKALLFHFLKLYKQYRNEALKIFRNTKITFSTAPILNMGGPLGRHKSGRITSTSINNSARGNSARGNSAKRNSAKRNSARGNSARGNSARGNSARGNSARPRGSLIGSVRSVRSLIVPIERCKVYPMLTNNNKNTQR